MGERWTAVGLGRDLLAAEAEGAPGLVRRRQERLEALVAHARVYSPFFRELYEPLGHGSIDGRRLPVTSKRGLMARLDDWVTDRRVRQDELEAFVADPSLSGVRYLDRYFVCRSSGTTGHPGIYVVDPFAISMIYAVGALVGVRMLRRARWNRLVANRFREASVIGTGGHFAGAGFAAFGRREYGGSGDRERIVSVQQPLDEIVRELEAFDPAMLMGYPSAIRQLAREQAAGRLRLRPGLVATAGESIAAEERHRLAAVFEAPVFDAYASSECLLTTVACPEDWLHYRSDWMLLEPVDASWEPVPSGEPSHTVLLTNLTNWVQPVIRYDLGDSVLVRPDRCPCGSPLPAIRVIGRRDDVLRFDADGRTVEVLPLAITADLEDVRGLERVQLVQADTDRLDVRLRCAGSVEDADVWGAVAGRLRAFLRRHGLDGVEVVRDDRPPDDLGLSGKFHQVVGLPAPGPGAG